MAIDQRRIAASQARDRCGGRGRSVSFWMAVGSVDCLASCYSSLMQSWQRRQGWHPAHRSERDVSGDVANVRLRACNDAAVSCPLSRGLREEVKCGSRRIREACGRLALGDRDMGPSVVFLD